MKLRNLILAATVVALPAIAKAQPVTGLYVGAGVGVNELLNMKQQSGVAGASNIASSTGAMGSISLGYGFGNGFRLEVQPDYRWNQGHLSGVSASGHVDQYGGFVNALYDFSAGWPVYPYVGGGIGYQMFHLGNSNNSLTSNGYPAIQGIAGVAYPLASVPGLSLTAEARGETSIDHVTGTRSGKSVTYDAATNISGLIGIRYAFGAKPAPAPMAPAPVAVPAPAPARSFLVFFDWDKADLTARAKSIIAEAADSSKKVATTTVDVSGHADKTGTAAYNKALSLRRAQTVAAEMVRLGVPEKEIVINAYGDSKPLVPTAPGVREPQNRRVEIVLK